MQCPKCKKDINLGKQVREADKDFYQEIEPPIILMIFCENCEIPVASIDIVSVTEFEEIDSPGIGKVKIPKL
jgi:hypothetical protein